tara:strand:+ start:174 stop:353 length:180 start_codon:yes stop_codon:yes gene_type:complete
LARFSKGGVYTYKGVEYPNTSAGYAAYVRAIRKDKRKGQMGFETSLFEGRRRRKAGVIA